MALPIERTPSGVELLVETPVPVESDWSAPLLVRRGNPSDDPVTHTIRALLDLTSAVTGDAMDQADRRLLADLSFPVVGDPDRSSELSVAFDSDVRTAPELGPGARYRVRATQDEVTTCRGALELVRGTGPATTGRADYSVFGVIEASRRFLTLLVREAASRPLDTRIMDFAAEVPCAVSDDESLALRWRPEPLRGNRLCVHMELIGGAGMVLGWFGYGVLAGRR
jgi:hypothetical protein